MAANLNRGTAVTNAQGPIPPAPTGSGSNVYISSMVIATGPMTITSTVTTSRTFSFPAGVYPYNPDGWYQGINGEGVTFGGTGAAAVVIYSYS